MSRLETEAAARRIQRPEAAAGDAHARHSSRGHRPTAGPHPAHGAHAPGLWPVPVHHHAVPQLAFRHRKFGNGTEKLSGEEGEGGGGGAAMSRTKFWWMGGVDGRPTEYARL